jgi:hypothetical protein
MKSCRMIRRLNSRASFQVFLSTDSIKSYVLYKYKACPTDLALKASSGLTHSNSGILKEVIIDHGQQCTSSNVGQTGVWVIEVTSSASGKNFILSKQNLYWTFVGGWRGWGGGGM